MIWACYGWVRRLKEGSGKSEGRIRVVLWCEGIGGGSFGLVRG